jgi:hypothetical protein
VNGSNMAKTSCSDALKDLIIDSNIVGLQRTDNNMDFASWPLAQMINQKNYYTYVSSLFHKSRTISML